MGKQGVLKLLLPSLPPADGKTNVQDFAYTVKGQNPELEDLWDWPVVVIFAIWLQNVFSHCCERIT